MNESLKIDLSETLPRLTEEIAAQLRKKAVDSFSYEVQNAIQQEIRRYITQSIVPTITKDLEREHEKIRAAFVLAVKDGCEAVAATMVESTKKRLAGYEGDTLVRDFFNKIFDKPGSF